MAVVVRFACGHGTDVPITATTAPVCHCGETRIQRVQTRPPTFTGACTGPYAVHKSLEAVPVALAPGGSLNLKPPKE